MSIDYDLLREILKRTTPGPWTVEDDGYDIIVGDEEGHSLGWGDQVRFKFEAGDQTHDPALVALAPDLARELLRLRRELTDLRDLMYTHAGHLRKDGHDTAADWTENHALRLAQIMRGDTE